MASRVVDISVLGDKALERRLRRMAPKVQKKMARTALRNAAKLVAWSAKTKAPVDTGRLRDNIKVRAAKARRGNFGAIVRTGTRAEMGIAADATWYYPAIVEYGPRDNRGAAQPYLRPALDENRPKALALIRRELWAAVTDTGAI